MNIRNVKVFPFTSSRYYPILCPKFILLEDLCNNITLTAGEYAYSYVNETFNFIYYSDTFFERFEKKINAYLLRI